MVSKCYSPIKETLFREKADSRLGHRKYTVNWEYLVVSKRKKTLKNEKNGDASKTEADQKSPQ